MQEIDRDSQGLIQEFIVQADVGEHTSHKYGVHLREYARWLAKVPRRTVTSATPGDVRRFMAYLKGDDRFAAAAHHRTSGVLAPSTRKNVLSSIHSFYRYLLAVQVIDIDPSAAVTPPRVVHKPGVHLTAQELRALLDSPGSDPRERFVTFLLAYTGARVNEVRLLRWMDVDLHERTMMVRGKGDKFRVIDIHPALMVEMRRWWFRQDEIQHRYPGMREAMSNPERAYVLIDWRIPSHASSGVAASPFQWKSPSLPRKIPCLKALPPPMLPVSFDANSSAYENVCLESPTALSA